LNLLKKPVPNPVVVFREEFDDWAILFHPDTMKAIGLNPLGVFIWKHLNGINTLADILTKVREFCDEVPEEADEHLEQYISELVTRGFVGFEVKDFD
jgi:SynChlorMet cassette protein ScmD